MDDLDKKQPQVNPPRMATPDLSKAEMEVRELIEKSEKGERMNTNSSENPSSKEDDSFHMNKQKEEDL